jgi:methylenetetrahydrofolate dehydrogenase (NADP+)/methenyltetrahydrofolate cyclohydrolase
LQKILKGKVVADKIIDKIRILSPKRSLGVIKVGSDPGSSSYLRGIRKTAERAEVEIKVSELAENSMKEEIIESVKEMRESNEINGILLMEPFPKEISIDELIEIVAPEFDVEGIHPYNMGKLLLGEPQIIPSTPGAVLELMDFYGIDTEGAHTVILGRSKVVGKPLANLLLRKNPLGNATVTVCHSKTENLEGLTETADILIAAIGKAEFVTEEFVREGVIVIDVGINMKDNHLVGDVDFESVKEKAHAITPVPGGVGSITTAVLLSNLYKL